MRQVEEEEEEEPVQAKSETMSVVTPSVKAELEATRGSGTPLSRDVRAFMEPRFGRDFGGVRVHTGARAAGLARQLRAQAFTRGADVHFASGKYAPATAAGKRLVAHELAHTVQQGAGVAPALIQRTIGDGHDLESPRYKGDAILEACYDDERLLRYGDRGPAVAKVQEGVTEYFLEREERDPLPVYGIDGIFKSETKRAVEDFQASEGLTGKHVDGIVGPITMGYLDKFHPAPAPPVFPPIPKPPSQKPKKPKKPKKPPPCPDYSWPPLPPKHPHYRKSKPLKTSNSWNDRNKFDAPFLDVTDKSYVGHKKHKSYLANSFYPYDPDCPHYWPRTLWEALDDLRKGTLLSDVEDVYKMAKRYPYLQSSINHIMNMWSGKGNAGFKFQCNNETSLEDKLKHSTDWCRDPYRTTEVKYHEGQRCYREVVGDKCIPGLHVCLGNNKPPDIHVDRHQISEAREKDGKCNINWQCWIKHADDET